MIAFKSQNTTHNMFIKHYYYHYILVNSVRSSLHTYNIKIKKSIKRYIIAKQIKFT